MAERAIIRHRPGRIEGETGEESRVSEIKSLEKNPAKKGAPQRAKLARVMKAAESGREQVIPPMDRMS